jgi:hypothetical protein
LVIFSKVIYFVFIQNDNKKFLIMKMTCMELKCVRDTLLYLYYVKFHTKWKYKNHSPPYILRSYTAKNILHDDQGFKGEKDIVVTLYYVV